MRTWTPFYPNWASGPEKKRAPVEPILLPVPEFAHEKNDPLPEIPQPAPEKAPEPAAEPEPEPAPVEDEVPTVELPDIKAYSEAEAQKAGGGTRAHYGRGTPRGGKYAAQCRG